VRPQLRDRAPEVLVAGGTDDRPVEPVGQLVERPGPGLRGWPTLDPHELAAHRREHPAEFGVGGRGLGGLADGRRLEEATEVEEVADALQAHPRHTGALPRHEVHQALGGQPAQRLPHRRAGRPGALDQ
jgi:hypothetical protein